MLELLHGTGTEIAGPKMNWADGRDYVDQNLRRAGLWA
jgi:hypothetical protein